MSRAIAPPRRSCHARPWPGPPPRWRWPAGSARSGAASRARPVSSPDAVELAMHASPCRCGCDLKWRTRQPGRFAMARMETRAGERIWKAGKPELCRFRSCLPAFQIRLIQRSDRAPRIGDPPAPPPAQRQGVSSLPARSDPPKQQHHSAKTIRHFRSHPAFGRRLRDGCFPTILRRR